MVRTAYANLRVFEVLASGALLLTSMPTELTALDFQLGVHFVGFREPAEITPLVRRFLNDDQHRQAIGGAARSLTLDQHTYDRRAERILARLAQTATQKLAPARSWPDARARLAALDFYSAHGLTGCAAKQFGHVAGRGFRETIRGASLLMRSCLK